MTPTSCGGVVSRTWTTVAVPLPSPELLWTRIRMRGMCGGPAVPVHRPAEPSPADHPRAERAPRPDSSAQSRGHHRQTDPDPGAPDPRRGASLGGGPLSPEISTGWGSRGARSHTRVIRVTPVTGDSLAGDARPPGVLPRPARVVPRCGRGVDGVGGQEGPRVPGGARAPQSTPADGPPLPSPPPLPREIDQDQHLPPLQGPRTSL